MAALVVTPARTSWRRVLWTWAEGWSDLKAIWQPQNAGRPALPYLALQVIANVKDGQDLQGAMVVSGSPEQVRRPLEGFRGLTLSVNGYGPGCLEALEALRASLDLEEVKVELEEGSLASVGSPDLQDLSELVDQRFEERGNLTVEFSLAQEAEEDLGGFGYFNRMEGQVTLESGGQETEHEFEAPPAP
jgi:hypothetical protein